MRFINKNKLNEALLSLILALYIYDANYTFLPIGTSKIIWLFALLGLFFFSLAPQKKQLNIYTFKIFFFRFFPFLLLGTIVLIMSLFMDTSGITVPAYILSYYLDLLPACVFFVLFLAKLSIEPSRIINIIITVGIIQSIMMFSMVLIPSWKNIYSLITINNGFILDYYSYRYVGITGFANYTVGTTQATIFILHTVHCIEKKSFNLKNNLISLILFFSAIYASRSSFIIIIPCLIFIFLFNTKSKKFFINFIPKYFLFLFLLISVLIYLLLNEDLVDNTPVLKWALEPILNFQENGSFTTNSSSYITNYYYMPSLETFYWGDWVYTNKDGSYYMHNDAGYMRMLLFMGIYLSISFYIIFLFCWVYSIKAIRKADKNTFYFLMLLVVIFFILQYKGNIFIDGFGMMKIMMLILLSKYTTLQLLDKKQ